MNGYDLTRKWFDFALSNPDKVSSNHTALYLWTIELNNRLGWIEKFGLTVREAMDGMSCKSRNTYLKCFHDLIDWKFIGLVVKSQNQYQCNVIALLNFEQPKSKRLFKNSTPTDTITSTINGSTTGTITDTIPKTIKPKKPKNKTAVDKSTCYSDCMELYNQFILDKTTVPAKIDGIAGMALNKIIAYLKTVIKDKDHVDEGVKNALSFVFQNYEKWDSFHKGQLKLNQIESNLINIINSIKNGKQQLTTKQPQSKYRTVG